MGVKKRKKRKRGKQKELFVSARFKKIFGSFKTYFQEQMKLIEDDSLNKEMDILAQLSSESLDTLVPIPKPPPQIIAPVMPWGTGPMPPRMLGRPYNICDADGCCDIIDFRTLVAEVEMVKSCDNNWTLTSGPTGDIV